MLCDHPDLRAKGIYVLTDRYMALTDLSQFFA